MKFVKMLQMLLSESQGKDKKLLKAEVTAFLKDRRVRKGIEQADYETRTELRREIEAILGEPLDLEAYEMSANI